MKKARAIIRSLRLRTLPLSLSGIILGSMLAIADYKVIPLAVALLAVTAVFLQILSNLSNELGDTLKGTDAAREGGPMYALNAGLLTISDMKKLIAVFVVLSLLSTFFMVYVAFGTPWCMEGICFLLLGVAAVISAMRYTLGPSPYGYRALGDIYVFIFFGLTTVLGSYFILAREIPSWLLLLPAAAVGFFSVGVLNINNIRDAKSDALTRKTVAILLGDKWSRIYQTALIVAGWLCALAFCSLRFFDLWHYLFLLTLPMFIIHLRGAWRLKDKDLDPMLPILVMGTFIFSILMGLGFIMFLL